MRKHAPTIIGSLAIVVVWLAWVAISAGSIDFATLAGEAANQVLNPVLLLTVLLTYLIVAMRVRVALEGPDQSDLHSKAS